MATSIAAQLEALKSFVRPDVHPQKRPLTRPSILFDPKEAADIDIETILSIALQGLDVLIIIDERFRKYKSDLFSHRSKELDRELMGLEENNQIDVSISSYLRILSGHFALPSAAKTLEYLIRRYKIHVYNAEDLILCIFPYHDTHAFVQIVQLIDTRNGRWKFLDGVKASGASPPRKVLVQQCICDKGVLEVICNYASPSKKFHPSKHVTSFAAAVCVEVLGSLPIVDDDILKRILPFVISAFQPGVEGYSDHKAAALMIIGLLGNKVALAPKLVHSFIRSIAEVARENAKDLTDLQWCRLSLMALVHLVQSQKVDLLPKKALEILKEIRDLAGILLGLSKEFNIDKFLSMLLGSLVDYSSDDMFHQPLVAIVETVPMKALIDHLVAKVLNSCLKLSSKSGDSIPSLSGGWAKKILIVLSEKYPSELHRAVQIFLQDNKVKSKKGGSVYKIFSKMLDGLSDSPSDILDSRIWFSLYHPKAEVRRATLEELNSSGVLKSDIVVSQNLVNVKEAILRQLRDDDLTVIQAALSIDGLSDLISSCDLLEALDYVHRRCIGSLLLGSSDNICLNVDVAVASLIKCVRYFHDQSAYLKRIAAMIFPLLLILPKTQKLSMQSLELAKEINWPLYHNLAVSSSPEVTSKPASSSLINMKTISSLAENFMMHPKDYSSWFVENCGDFELSKTLFFLVLMQIFMMPPNSDKFIELFECAFPILKTEWQSYISAGGVSLEEFDSKMLDWDCSRFLNNLPDTNIRTLNAYILICVYWRLLGAFIYALPSDVFQDDNEKWVCKIRDLFVLFASSQCKNVFSDHLCFLVSQCKISPVHFLSKFFTEEGIPLAIQRESLRCFAFLCVQSQEKWSSQLLAAFPLILVPLAGDDQDTRIAAVTCIEGLHTLWAHVGFSGKKNGSNPSWSHFLGELLCLMDEQKRLILSDKQFLPSFLVSLLSSSPCSILVPGNLENRFGQSMKEKIIAFILCSALKLSDYGKLRILSLLKGIGHVIMQVKEALSLFSELMRRHSQYNSHLENSCQKLSNIEVKILCLLLESCIIPSSSAGIDLEDHLVMALRIRKMPSEDPVFVQPCISVLNKLNGQFYSGLKNEVKENIFCELVFLFRNANGDIQNATREALLRMNISCSTISHILDFTINHEIHAITPGHGKKKKKSSSAHQPGFCQNDRFKGEDIICFLCSLLDILLLKKDITERHLLMGPLFKVLHKVISEDWVTGIQSQDGSSTSLNQVMSSSVFPIEQTLLIIMGDIAASLHSSVQLKDEVTSQINIKLLVECARSCQNGVTRNHVFSLIASLARIIPEKVLEHTLDVLTVMGQSAITQFDSHSQHVCEDLISAMVPCWLSNSDNMDELLQIFVDVLPDVADHRRLSIIVYLLRTLGEHKSLASLLFLLFHSLVSRKGFPLLKDVQDPDAYKALMREWEYTLSVQICEQYSSTTWLPVLIMLLRQIGKSNISQDLFLSLFFVMQFTLHKLQDPELSFKLTSTEDSVSIQSGLEELLEQVVFLLQVVDAKGKQLSIPVVFRKAIKESMCVALKNITIAMIPSSYFASIIKLLGHAENNVRKKALGILCETVKDQKMDSLKRKGWKQSNSDRSGPLLSIDEHSQELFDQMCLAIVRVVDDSRDGSNMSLKVAAVSAIDVLANKFPCNYTTFGTCLSSVIKCITSCSIAVSSSCLKAASALINALGPRAMVDLPCIMENVIKLYDETNQKAKAAGDHALESDESVLLSVLYTLEAVVDKLGGFLNPYLGNIIEMLVLHPEFVSSLDSKLKLRAHVVRNLLAEKIPVRLALPPLLKAYPAAVESGDSSLVVLFDLLALVIGSMDRTSVGSYHGEIFDMCLLGLDLRRQHPASVQNVDAVEKTVINTMVALTMKLTESMFKPLFVRSIEWAESDAKKSASKGCMDRTISFYGLINKLAENHRSLFVPYFKYLLDSCVCHLSDLGDMRTQVLSQKKKKLKIIEEDNVEDGSTLFIKKWHLRALILSSLHKCFRYDSGSLKFLDSSNFQILLKPIVSQLVLEPPSCLGENPNVPSVKEVDDLLVSCVGQMAVTSGSDLLWKPLNHEVLMQTRSEKVRARILGLRIVHYLLQNLREEYLVFLAETIPFLAELLEDVELPVKSLTQDILREMESLSGESLKEYLV